MSKYVSMNVEFKDPVDDLKQQLERNGARSVSVKRNYYDDIEVQYTLKSSNPEKIISKIIEQAGADNVRANKNYNGARFEFKIDDIIDEYEFKRKISSILRDAGFRAN